MNIILITGKAGSGKNRAALKIKEKLGNTVITSLSKYIKLFALEMTSWDGNDENKPREFLQTMGDELRSIDSEFLCKRLLEDFQIYEKYYRNVIVSDVRLIKEIEFFKNISKYKVKTIYIDVSDDKIEANPRGLSIKEQEHITENEFTKYDNYDIIIKRTKETNIKNDN